MGVTLERVQNKFACIIGELCSEPLLLSQFAIWVDLRISEYKSKGTISLDCSGTTPDPSWLKGHVVQSIPTAGSSDNGRGRSGSASIRNSLPHKSIHSSRDPGRGSNYPSNNRTDGNVDNSDIGSDRISPDVQVIKQESDSAFPVSLHQHSAKKRHSEDDLSQGESFYEDSSFSGPKVRRMDSAADESSAVDSPSNQSFMSVIGDSLQDNDDASDNSMMVAGDEQSKGGNQSFGFTPRAGTSFSMPSTSATPGTSSSAGRFDRTHTCGECGFTFSRAGHLKRHMLTHAPAPPKFDCSLCDRKYSRKEHLTRHIMKGHSPHAEAKRAALAKRKTIKTNSSQTSGTENLEQSDAHALGSAAFPEQADTVYPIVSQDDQSQTSQHVTPYPGMGISSTITMATHQGLERLYPSVLHTATGRPTPSVANGDSAASVSAMRYNMNMGVASSDIITRLGEEQAMGWFKNT